MALSFDQFVSYLTDSGLIAAEDITSFVSSLPNDRRPTDGEQLARELVKQKKLTKFQAEQIYLGKGKSLVLGNYTILDKLGQGGMGMVLKAEHKRLKRLVAIKVMSPAALKTPDALKRFHREVEAAAKLRHTNVVATDDADEAKGTHFLVMEYVEGSDLSALVKKNGPLSVEQAVQCILQAARGLEYAHQQGVVHRDIKPANLLLDAKGTVKILDMGLARIEGDSAGRAELTSTGAVMGTVDYMAPEQALSTKTADARSDIYSLGISLWYLLAGKCAYDGDTLMAKLLAHRDAPIPSLCALRAEVPASVDAVFQKMVAKQAKDRYQSMTDVIRDLTACQSGSASTSSPATPMVPEDTNLMSFLNNLSGPSTSVTATRQLQPTTTHAAVDKAAEATMLTSNAAQATDPQTMASVRSGQNRKKRASSKSAASPAWWQDKRIQIGVGLAVPLILVLAMVVTRSDPAKTAAPPSGDKLASVVASVSTLPESETAPAQNSIASQQPGPSTAPRISLAYDGNIRARVPSLVVDRNRPYTIEAWATPQSTFPNGSGIVFLTPESSLGIVHDKWRMGLENLGLATAERSLDVNRRVHVAGVRSTTELILFVDGIVVARRPLQSGTINGPCRFYIGTGGKFGYKGLIDEVRVSTGVRYPTEFVPSDQFEADKDTIALYRFDEGEGGSFRDSSGNGHHGYVEKLENGAFHQVSSPKWVGINPTPSTNPTYPKDKSDLPDGFTPLFNGKDLTGWKGEVGDPKKRALMTPAELASAQVKADERMQAHWRVENGVLTFDGQGDNLCTAQDYADFELYLEWNIPAGGDSGVYLRGAPQVQIWDSAVKQYGNNMGSGGLFNNRKHSARPLVNADQPIGQWNAMLIRMVGDKVTVGLNGQLVVDNVVFENHVEPDEPIYPSGPIELQKFGSPLHFRNVLIRKLSANANTGEPQDAPPPAIAPFDAMQACAHQEAWAKHLGTTVETTNSVGAKMILIPPGEFLMGSTDEQVAATLKVADQRGIDPKSRERIQNAEVPQHRVVIAQPFRLGATEVTAGEFAQFLAATGYKTEAEREGSAQPRPATASSGDLGAAADFPATWVNWSDATAYCEWLSGREKKRYRLPTEAEWEYVCRAGTTTHYSFGDDHAALDRFAWNFHNAGGSTHPVRKYPANAFGLSDMHGNVSEWCSDRWDPAAYRQPAATAGDDRVLRGGNWKFYAILCRSASRYYSSRFFESDSIGFRVVEELSSQPIPAAPSVRLSPPTPAKAPFDAKQARAHQEAWAKHLGTTVETTNSVGAKMILIPPGEFLMGSTDEQIESALKLADEISADEMTKNRIRVAERPRHRVKIGNAFRMGSTEVTIGQFEQFVEAEKYQTEAERYGFGNSPATTSSDTITAEQRKMTWRTPGYPVTTDSPVTQVTWSDACAFCNWLSRQEKLALCYQSDARTGWLLVPMANGYRLLTEAEWEYACRAGSETAYSFGLDASMLGDYAWFRNNANGQPRPVATKLPNPFGLYDMHGNVSEWCQDWFDEKWYEKSPINDPQGPPGGGLHSVRGGSWSYGLAALCSSANRNIGPPTLRAQSNGFRVVQMSTPR